MKNKNTIVNGLIWFVLSVVLVIAGISGDMVPAEAASAGTITVAVERFSIGQGYLIEPYITTFQSGDTYETVCRRILEENGYGYDTKGASFYLSGISGADGGAISIPSCIAKIGAKKIGIKNVNPPDNSAVNEYAGNNAWLGEFSYSRMSGWMYSVGNDNGHEFPGVGMDGRTPKDGDVFRLQFTVWGYGEDLTGCGYSDSTKIYYPVGNKTALTRKIAQINQNKQIWFALKGCEAAYNHAVQVLQKLDATQQELDNALAQLPSEEPVFPDKVTLQETQAVLCPGDTLNLKVTLSPGNVNQSALVWSTSDSSVVSVDQNGLVTAAGAGSADITVKTQNDKTAVCHVTVKDRMITKLILNMDSAYLKIGQSIQIQVDRYEPENATEKPEFTYTSSNPSVASADAQGKVTALKTGDATITVRIKSGVSAECKIMVGTPQELAQMMETEIENLPSQVTDENVDQVLVVWEKYSALSEEIKEKVSPEAAETLEKRKQEADVVLEKQAQVKNVCQMLEELPLVEKLSMSDEDALKKARSAYDSLDTELQNKIEENLKEKLEALEKQMLQLKAEADSVKKEIAGFTEQVRVENIAEAANIWKKYLELEEGQNAYIYPAVGKRMEEIADQILSCMDKTVQAVNPSGKFDLNAAAIRNFITVSNVYDAMGTEQTKQISEKTRNAISSIREWMGNNIHAVGEVHLTAPWYVRLIVKDGTGSSAWKNAVISKYSSNAYISLHKIISYQDIRSGKTYLPDKALELRIDLSGVKDLNHPSVDLVTEKGTSVVLTELESQFKDSSITFQTSHTGNVLIVSNPIVVTKITVPSREYVGIGKTISIEVKYTPFNATTDKTLVFKSSDSSIVKVLNSGKLKGIAPGSVNVTVSLKENPSVKAVCKVTVTDQANKLKKSTEQVLKETSEYMLSIDKNPTVGSEWFVLGLARGGKSLKSSYFQTYYNHIANYLEENDGKLTNTVKYTEYSKQILVMTAIGKDARNIAGYNLLENLADFDKITEQGFNGPIWALIALKCNPDYTIPKVSGVSVQTTEKKLVQYLLDGEIAGGGWSLQGEEPDTDITAMTLQALAPYYNQKGYEKVTAAIDRGVNCLSNMQLETGGFGTMGAETLESNAQVITALCALGIDPQKDARFIKNGRWTVENLISYHISDSGFMHVKAGAATNGGGEGGVVNGMATEQGYYALVAYQRFQDGKTSLYDMSDLTAQEGEKGDGSGTGITDSQDNQIKGNSVGKTAGKKAVETQKESSGKAADEKKDAKGWSFDGKTYVPVSTAEADTESGTAAEQEVPEEPTGSTVTDNQSAGAEDSYIAVFIMGTALAAGIVSITGRRRRKQNEKKN